MHPAEPLACRSLPCYVAAQSVCWSVQNVFSARFLADGIVKLLAPSELNPERCTTPPVPTACAESWWYLVTCQSLIPSELLGAAQAREHRGARWDPCGRLQTPHPSAGRNLNAGHWLVSCHRHFSTSCMKKEIKLPFVLAHIVKILGCRYTDQITHTAFMGFCWPLPNIGSVISKVLVAYKARWLTAITVLYLVCWGGKKCVTDENWKN